PRCIAHCIGPVWDQGRDPRAPIPSPRGSNTDRIVTSNETHSPKIAATVTARYVICAPRHEARRIQMDTPEPLCYQSCALQHPRRQAMHLPLQAAPVSRNFSRIRFGSDPLRSGVTPSETPRQCCYDRCSYNLGNCIVGCGDNDVCKSSCEHAYDNCI